MEIQRGKNALKAITVEDIAYGDRENNKVFFTTPKDESGTNALLEKEAHILSTVQESNENERLNYNNQLTNLDIRYTSLTPLNSYIVRMMILEDEIKQVGESKLILPKTSFARKQTNAGTIGDKIVDPFRFKPVAVIVAVPSFEEQLKPGMLVHIIKPRVIVDGDAIVGYTDEYVHPDYNDNQVPQTPSNPDFGYAIISRQQIKVII